MGPSLTRRGLAVLAGLVVRDPVALGRADRVDLVVLDPALVVRDPVVLGRADPRLEDLADPADIRHRVDLADLAVLGRVDRVDPRGRADRVGPAHLVLAGRVDLVVLTDIKGLAGLVGPADWAAQAHLDRDRAGRVDLLDQGMDRVGPAHLDLAGQVDRVDRRRRSTHPGALTSGVAPRWAAPGIRLTASAHPTTVRRRRPRNMGSVGTVGLLPERRRLSGTDPRPRVAGAVHRLPAVGTAHGMGRRATSESRRPISGRSITTGTTRSRSSTRFSGDGASGSSESGFRCTDTT